MPLPVTASVARPIVNPSIAMRPFHFSANSTKPNLALSEAISISRWFSTLTQPACGSAGPLGRKWHLLLSHAGAKGILQKCLGCGQPDTEDRNLFGAPFDPNLSPFWHNQPTPASLFTKVLSYQARMVYGAQVTQEDGGRLNAFAKEPRMEVVDSTQSWGFHERAEKLNGRMAMLGFVS
eukprot:g43261.t1